MLLKKSPSFYIGSLISAIRQSCNLRTKAVKYFTPKFTAPLFHSLPVRLQLMFFLITALAMKPLPRALGSNHFLFQCCPCVRTICFQLRREYCKCFNFTYCSWFRPANREVRSLTTSISGLGTTPAKTSKVKIKILNVFLYLIQLHPLFYD